MRLPTWSGVRGITAPAGSSMGAFAARLAVPASTATREAIELGARLCAAVSAIEVPPSVNGRPSLCGRRC